MKTNTLVIMAAGFGSRYKGGVKQMAGIGPNGEWIMDYSIYDAYQAGIRKVVIIIREELNDVMSSHFKDKLPKDLKLVFVNQNVKDIPTSFEFPNRIKPWGTGHAILCCKDVIQEPFMVINADDYYGNSSFSIVNDFLMNHTEYFCMAGFLLQNTLSENGGVNRGICQVDESSNLIGIEEIYQIEKIGTSAKGKMIDGKEVCLDLNCYCSLNLWGFTPRIFDLLESTFIEFLDSIKEEETQEFLLPSVVEYMIKQNQVKLKVLPTNDEWFGMTYQEDKELVQKKIEDYHKMWKYPNPLWCDK